MVLGWYIFGMEDNTLNFDSPITPPYFMPGLVVEKYMAERDLIASQIPTEVHRNIKNPEWPVLVIE